MSPLGTVHVALALLCILIGAQVALAPKGTVLHRRLGWAYAVSMLAVNGTALSLYRLTGTFTPFHAAALFSLVTVVAGVLPARRRGRGWLVRHAWWMSGSYVGLVAAAAAESLSRWSRAPFWGAVVAASLASFLLGMLVMRWGVPRALRRVRLKG